jgi:hypothetical protein
MGGGRRGCGMSLFGCGDGVMLKWWVESLFCMQQGAGGVFGVSGVRCRVVVCVLGCNSQSCEIRNLTRFSLM